MEVCRNPFMKEIKYYSNEHGFKFCTHNRFNYFKEASPDNIPFIMEPRLSKINKDTESSYFTYSLGKRDLLQGVYFDEQEIVEVKKYAEYNADTYVIIFGESIAGSNFIEESLVLYRYLYGTENVSYIKIIKILN